MTVLLDVLGVFVKENPGLFSVGVLVMCITPVTTTLLPGFYGAFFEQVVQKQRKQALRLFYTLVFCLAVSYVASFLNDVVDSYQVPVLLQTLRSVFVRRLLEKFEGNWKEVNSGELLSKLLRVEYLVGSWYVKLKSQVVPFVLSFLLVILYFLSIDGVVSLALTLAMPTVLWFFGRRGCDRVSTESSGLNSRVHEEAEDVFRNLLQVLTARTQEYEVDRLLSFEKRFHEKKTQSLLCTAKKKLVTALVVVLLMAVVLYRVKTGVLQDRYTASQMYAAVIVGTYLLDNTPWFLETVNEFVAESDAVKDVDRELRRGEGGRRCDPAFTGGSGAALVAFGVTHSYDGREVLRDVSLTVSTGEVLLVKGAIGKGKSTLLRILAGAVTPDRGVVLVDGKCGDFSGVGYIPQNPTLFARTVYENVAHGTDASREEVKAVLSEYKLKVDVDTVVGKNGSMLSGGQRQIVLFAKFVIRPPKVLLMDEPTASLDGDSKTLFAEGVRRLVQGGKCTVVLSSHDPVVLAVATRVVQL